MYMYYISYLKLIQYKHMEVSFFNESLCKIDTLDSLKIALKANTCHPPIINDIIINCDKFKCR